KDTRKRRRPWRRGRRRSAVTDWLTRSRSIFDDGPNSPNLAQSLSGDRAIIRAFKHYNSCCATPRPAFGHWRTARRNLALNGLAIQSFPPSHAPAPSRRPKRPFSLPHARIRDANGQGLKAHVSIQLPL